MEKHHREFGPKYLVWADSECWGTVMAEISGRGGLIEGIAGDEGAPRTIHARIPEGEVVQFEAWLNTTPGVRGRLYLNDAANDHDD